MTARERCLAAGAEDAVLFAGDSYDTALIGITEDGRAVYDFYKMVDWLMEAEGIDQDEAVDWIYRNTIGSLINAGPFGPIIMHPID